jgi:hypothetical protein
MIWLQHTDKDNNADSNANKDGNADMDGNVDKDGDMDEDKDGDKDDGKGGETVAELLMHLDGPSPVTTLLKNLWCRIPPDVPQSALDDMLDVLGNHSRLLAA